MGSFVGCFEKKTPAKRLRLTFHNRIRTERFGECGARPGQPDVWGGVSSGWLDLFLLEHAALKFFPARETSRLEALFPERRFRLKKNPSFSANHHSFHL